MKKLVAPALLIAASQIVPVIALSKDPTLYDRVEARLNRDPALAKIIGHPAREMGEVAWMIGSWDIETRVDAVPGRASEKGRSDVKPVLGGVWLEIRDTYPQGNQDISYLSFNPASRQWMSMTVDGVGNAVTSMAPRWQNGKLVFVSDVVVIGERAMLRQTIIKIGDRAYTVTNEERMRDGHWQLLDTYRYTKRP